MNLLAAALYDPSTAVVNKATTAAIAMTAFDTTNLRLTITAPPSGRIWVKIVCSIHGATTCPQIVLGTLEGSTVRGRVAPEVTVSNLAATSLYRARAEFTVVGLTPGQSYVLDAAYGVETVVASTNIKYGGPNNTTANDNFGAFQFEIWDPSPSYTPAVNGVPPTTTMHQKLDTIDTTADAILVDTDVIGSTGQGLTSLATQASVNTVDTVVDAVKLKTDNLPADPADASVIAGRFDSVDAAIAGIEGGGGLDAAGVRDAIGLASANLDTQLAALPTAAEIVTAMDADSADLDLILSGVASVFARTDVATSTRLAAADYDAPDNAGIAAIQAKTDSLNFTVAGKLDVNVLVINGVTVAGAGSSGSPWGPA